MTTQDENENPVKILCTEITNDFTPKITTISYKGKIENGVMIDKVIEIHNNDSSAHSAIVNVLNNKNNAQDIEIAKKVNASSLASVATSGEYNDLTGKPTLADVATSGSYNDLSDTPTIPSAQVNSDWNAQSGAAQILNKPSIPTKTSDLTNDSGFISYSNFPIHALKSYVDEGELLTDTEGLNNVTNYAHSTFDSSKFTITGSPTITSNGIASGFSSAYLCSPSIDFSSASSWKIKGEISTSTNTSGTQRILTLKDTEYRLQILLDDGDFYVYIFPHNISQFNFVSESVSANTTYYYEIEFTGSSYKAKFGTTRNNLAQLGSYTTSEKINLDDELYFGSDATLTSPFLGTIDLKQSQIIIDNVPIFTGNQTGVDTYTINGSTVSVAYTLSKTGSKIVDSSYRTQVTSVYNEFGNTPYYTINEGVNYTLPQGELYGKIESKLSASTLHITETYKNGSSWYRVYSDGWCEQGGYLTNTLTSAGSLNLTLLKSFADTNYSFHRSPVWVSIQNATTDPYAVGYLSKTTSNVTFGSHTASYVSSINWYACGYIS